MFGMGTVTTKLCEPNKYMTCIVLKRKEKKKKDIIFGGESSWKNGEISDFG